MRKGGWLWRRFKGHLWQHPDFLKLWAGQTVSRFGSQVSGLAIPSLAIVVLHASPVQVGLLTAVGFLPHLYTVALVAGVGSVFFDISYQSYLPVLIDRTDLVDGNSKLELTSSAAMVAGPGLAGVLMQVVGPALAVGIDAASVDPATAGTGAVLGAPNGFSRRDLRCSLVLINATFRML
ncbi:MAG: hypothetical protein ACYDGR_06900 [Candidatus Dormibacteria bacterium]